MAENDQNLIVGIGMPTYNRAPYLKHALDAFKAQTYRNIIVLISDNASTDDTQKMCEEYARQDKRFRYIRHEKPISRDGNTTFTLRELAPIVDLCMFTSDDDLAEPRFLEECVKALKADPKAGMAITNHDTIYYGSDKIIPKFMNLHVPSEKDLYKRLKQFTLFYSHDERSFCMSGIFRKEIVKDDYFEDKTESDVGFALRCLSRGYFLPVTDEVLFHKGVIPDIGKESIREMRFGPKKIGRAMRARLSRAGGEFRNMGFLLGVKELSLWQKTKLMFWNLLVVGRLFVSVKV